MRVILAGLGSVLMLSGCTSLVESYLRRPANSYEFPEHEEGEPPAEVAAVSLDATRRLVVSQRRVDEVSERRATCPEPPPDVALSVLSSAAIGFARAGNSAEAAETYQALAQAISTRTGAVEYWRTTSSTYCLLLMNGWYEAAQAYLQTAEEISTRFGGEIAAHQAATPGDQTITITVEPTDPVPAVENTPSSAQALAGEPAPSADSAR